MKMNTRKGIVSAMIIAFLCCLQIGFFNKFIGKVETPGEVIKVSSFTLPVVDPAEKNENETARVTLVARDNNNATNDAIASSSTLPVVPALVHLHPVRTNGTARVSSVERSNTNNTTKDEIKVDLWMPARYTLDDDLSNRSTRFPSIDERLRVYMSDWYAPPCSNDQKLRYRYSHVPVAGTSKSSSISNIATADGMDTPCTRMSANKNNFTGKNNKNNSTATLTNDDPATIIELVALVYSHKDQNETSRTTTTTTIHIPSAITSDHLFFLTHLIPNCAPLYSNMQRYCQDVVKTLYPLLKRSFPSIGKMPPLLLQFGDHAQSRADSSSTVTTTLMATNKTTTTRGCQSLHLLVLYP
jgi:hypothetical protein